MHSHRDFWREYPALGFGISALLGTFLFFEETFLLTFIWILYHFLLSRTYLHASLCLVVALYAHLLFSDLPDSQSGNAVFSIHSMQPRSSPFHKSWLYKGSLRSLSDKTLTVPCTVLYRGSEEIRPKANCDYLLSGYLLKRGDFDYTFQARFWHPLPRTWSLAEWRYTSKEKIRTILESHLKELHTSAFLTALFTGEIEERILRFEFGRLGLQHILAISGFHFAILAAFIATLMCTILPPRKRLWALLFAVTLYFLFVGNSPAVARSYFAITLYLVGQLLQRKSSGINILGGCLLVEVIFDPLVIYHVGFQLSYLSCFGILLLNPVIKRILHPLFPIRRFQQCLKLPTTSQCAYILSSFFSRSLCLTLAVNLALWPLLLYHFHRFPYLSLLYNLFVPQLAALCLFCLLLTLSLYAFFPLLSLPFFKFTDLLTGELLELVSQPPALLDFSLSSPFPNWAIAPYLALIFLIGLHFRQKTLIF